MKPIWTLAAMAPLAAHAASSAPCSALTDNVLTSFGCPADCKTTCVLFSPSQDDQCEPYQTSGLCLHDDAFVVPGTTAAAACNVTYQCLEALVDTTTKKWFLSLVKSSLSDKTVTTAAVTEIKQLTYPSDVSVVQVAGGLGRNVRGDVKNVKLDESFFATPASVVSFYLSDMNLPTFLDKINFSLVKWSAISLNNVNLDAVPAGLGSLSLQYIEMTKNFIKSINDSKPFAKATTLKLQENDLTDFPIDLPYVQTLNLSGNPLGTIPDSIFRMTNLQQLYMRNCNLTNLQLTEEQFAFLEQRQTFDANPVAVNCTTGFIPKNLTSGLGAVCVPGVLPESQVVGSKGGGSGSTTAIVIGVAAGVVVIAILAFFVRRRRKVDRNTDPGGYFVSGDKLNSLTNDTGLTQGSGDTYNSSIWNDEVLLAARVDHLDIKPIKLLSRGGFGEVWLGLYMNENVAIKRLLNDKKTMTDALAFASEIKIMARLEHPKIVRFIGVSWTNALTIQAVTEFMDCGDLRSLLDSSRASSLTWANLKCQIAIDVADALVYLHTLSPKLIHRDLKSRNVLIDANTGAKLSDFGISRNRSVEETMTAGVGTARWIAPEVILGGNYTEFADIYSFGVVLSELDTSKTPFHDATNTNGAKMQDVTILQLVSAGKLQPSFNMDCPEPIVKLARACMTFDPAQRPSAIHISYELRKILKDEL